MSVSIAAFLVMPLMVGIWLPDVFIEKEHTLAHERLASGDSFRVIQYWNHGDYYNTELVHTAPDGMRQIHVLDRDDGKAWKLPLAVDEPKRLAIVELRNGRVKKVQW